MNTEQKIIYFLGQLKARIEGFYAYAGVKGALVDCISELEEFFNKSVHVIYSQDEDDKIIAEIEELVKNNHDR